MGTYLARPVEVEALYFDGTNFDEVQELCETHRSTHKEWSIPTFSPIGTYFVSENPGHVAELWIEVAQNWVAVPAFVWIIKDERGCTWMSPENFRTHYTMKTHISHV
jgi:hypothetical protein